MVAETLFKTFDVYDKYYTEDFWYFEVIKQLICHVEKTFLL